MPDQPQSPPRFVPMAPDKPSGKAVLVGTVGTSAAALLLAMVGAWEGKRNDPYADIVGVMTVCYGETHVAMRRYSNAECSDMLAGSIADHARPVLARNPELAGHPEQLAAAVSLAYNIGPAAYARSSAARLFSAGQWREACDSFLKWSYAGGRQVKGLLKRRQAERAMCVRGLP
ncbi:MAG: lysozyme [Sphingomonadales bacterium]|nr:lysozyme [Sphingomonadales bacterium]